jgi:hypothetical protein
MGGICVGVDRGSYVERDAGALLGVLLEGSSMPRTQEIRGGGGAGQARALGLFYRG